jgi:fibronectin-binding autotransporter adhesin
VAGEGLWASVEIAQELALAEGVVLTPQAELSWSRVTLENFVGAGGLTVRAGDSDSLQLRLGLAAERRWAHAAGGETRVYGLFNITHELRGGTRVLVDTLALDSTAPEWTADLGVGVAHDWTGAQGQGSVFAELRATQDIGPGRVSGISGSIGMRLSW